MPSASWLNGWLSGDQLTAGEFKKGVGMVFDSTAGGAVASFDTGAIIPAGYAHLRVVLQARGDTAAVGTNLLVRFNNDSGANYDIQYHVGQASAAAAAESFAGTSGYIGSMAAASAPASVSGQAEMIIANYAGTTFQKTYLSQSATKTGTTTGLMFAYHISGFWRSTSAINRITVFPAAGNFVAGHRMTVYVYGV